MNLEATNLLKDSLFARRVLSIIREGGKLDQSKKEVFERVLTYLNEIKNGKDQIQTGTLVEHPVKSIVAYSKAMGIIADLPCDEEKNEEYFNNTLASIRKEVMGVLGDGSITQNNLKITTEYFREARKIAVQQSTRENMRGQELVTWQTPMQF